MTELGKLLREKREEKGMSLEELQTATKIQKRYLTAIEEGKYEVLPGTFYARAFIKNYCEAVGLHYETIFDEYAHEIPKAVKETSAEFEPRSKRAGSPVDTGNSIMKRIIPAVLIGILIIAVLTIVFMLLPDGKDEAKDSQDTAPPVELDEDKEKPNKKQEEEDKPAEEEKAAEEPEQKEEEPKQTLTKVGTDGNMSTLELSNTEKMVIELTAANGDSYVDVKDETGKSYFSTTLKSGETKQFDLTTAKEVMLNIGASHVTTIKVNGEPLTYPIPPTDMVHQKITIKKVQ